MKHVDVYSNITKLIIKEI